MVRKFLLILVLGNISFSIHPDILKKYQNGLDAYSDGNYQLTIQEMESILRQNWESPQLYYNLGNAYFREKSVGGSVWAYEKCLLLDPSHSDAKYNLSIANLNVIDKIETPEFPIYLKLYNAVKNYFNLNDWINILLLSLLAMSILVSVRKIFRLKWFLNFELLIIIELIIVFIFCLHSFIDDNSKSEGIIYEKVVVVFSEPNEYSSKIMEVHEGLKVKILNSQDGWINFELLDGTVGWIIEKQIRNI